jgi:sigma-B regulation protein RsbU (phosphoserine phosphatase)
MTRSSANPTIKMPEMTAPFMKQKKVLIADDSPTVIRMLNYMLSSLSCQVLTATDGVEAIKLSYSELPDLILLDILMPRMTGYQVCRLLKDDLRTKHIPIVMLTAKDQRSDRFWGLATGADEYIVKEFEDDRLLETIEEILTREFPRAAFEESDGSQPIGTVDVLSHANHLLDRQLFRSTITNRINELARSIQNFEETVSSVFELLNRILSFQIGALSVIDSRGANLRLFFYLPETVGAGLFSQVKRALIDDVSKENSFQDIEIKILKGESDPENERTLQSVCESALSGRNAKIGTMFLGDSRKDRFSDEDRETFLFAGSEIAVVLDNARLYDENARIYAELERELHRAHDIQKLMLPQENPMDSLVAIEAGSIPAKEVGGDYYDFYPLNEHQLLVTIGDVTGKGVPAALMMATIKTALQVRLEVTQDLKEVMAALNALVCSQASKQYMTLFLGIIDLKEQTIRYCNAGHNFPLILSVRENTLHYLEEGDLPFGFLDEPEYESYTRRFEEDDMFFFYTDGVIEARNRERELYGYPRLEELLIANSHEALSTIYLRLLKSLDDFYQESPLEDDMTMVLVQKQGPHSSAPSSSSEDSSSS